MQAITPASPTRPADPNGPRGRTLGAQPDPGGSHAASARPAAPDGAGAARGPARPRRPLLADPQRNPDAYLGLRTRLLRQAAGLTQQELGHRLGTTGQTVVNLELGRTRWRVRDLLALAPALDCDPVALLADLFAGVPVPAEAQIALLERRLAALQRQLAGQMGCAAPEC